ncbi:MAG: GTP-binding protein, partial [Chloroflexota bacterium]
GYLVGAAGALIVCDLTRTATLDALTRYTHQLQAVNPQVCILYVGNKADLTAERAITNEQLTAVTANLGGHYLLTSAKTGDNVETAFSQLADLIEGSSA